MSEADSSRPCEGMKDALEQPLHRGQYVMFAVGSGHWRSLVLRRVSDVDVSTEGEPYVVLNGKQARPIFDSSRLVIIPAVAIPEHLFIPDSDI